MAGAFFESFVIAEIIKSYYNKGIVEPPLYFYRDKDMNEIDLVIEENGTLYPLEIKSMRIHRRRIWMHSICSTRFPAQSVARAE